MIINFYLFFYCSELWKCCEEVLDFTKDIADEYSKLKVKCAIECNNDIDRYCKGKDAFIKFHEKKALDMIK